MAIGRKNWWGGPASWRLTRLLLAVLLLCTSASAAPSDAKEEARALAEQAGDALDAGNSKRAIELVTQAEALYHAPTHLIIAAEAHERLGALVEAAELYERIVAEPLPAGSPPAFKAAQNDAIERVRALIARIPSLLVRISPASARARITVDEQPFEGATDAAKRLNPGTHTVRASAAGFQSYEKTVELKRGGVVTLEITLQRVEGAEQAAPRPEAAATTAPTAPPDEVQPRSKVPAYIAFGVGVVGLGVGAVTGKMSLDRVAELDDTCPDKRCPSGRQADIDDARLLGNISTIGFGVGAAGIAAGVVLLITSGSTEEKRTARTSRAIQPWMTASSVGLRGSF
jgi:hypothetical protein